MQKLATSYFIIILALLYWSDTYSQQLDHVQGEVIIEVRNNNGLKSLIKELSDNSPMRSNLRPSLQARQIMSTPMNLWVLKVDHNEVNEIDFFKEVIGNRNVLLAQKNHISQLRAIPNDPRFAQQWQFINTGQNGGKVDADIDIEEAWDFTTGGLTVDGDSIVICVIDDGINLNHPDFENNLWVNHQEIPGNGIDDDGNGYIDDYRGWSAYDDNDNVTLDGDHGTPVAGVVGAKGNNSLGVSGINWDVKIMNVRGEGPEDLALASYAYPYTMRKLYNETNGEKGAFVVATNASWGVNFGLAEEAPIWCDFYNILGEVGILNFGATANMNIDVDELGDLPTTCESNYLVSVTNMNRFDEKHTSAGYGKTHIDLGAFGQQIYTVNYNFYGAFGGTSGACPMVAGTAALLYSVDCPAFINFSKSNPAQAALVIKDCILHGVDPNTSLQNITTTGGRLNAHQSVLNLLSTCGDCSYALGSDINALTDISATLTWFDQNNVGNTSLRYKRTVDSDWIEINDVDSGFEFTNLNPCTSYEYQIKTDCQSNPNAQYTYSRIFDTRGCCEIPKGITVSVEGENVHVQWEDVLAATNFVVEWREVGETDWTVVDIGMNNMIVLEGLLECIFFELRIKSECAMTNNESDFSEIIKISGECEACTKEFCSFNSKITEDEWIESVAIEDVFTNNSGVDPDGYGEYLGNFEIELTAEEEYTIHLTPGYSSLEYDEFFSVYIDYNQNGKFEEDDETIYKNIQFTQSTVSGSFVVPPSAPSGITRMRVIMRFGNSNGPCDELSFEFGEIEDYCVNIINETDCSSTFGAIVTDSTETSLTFEIIENNLAQFHLIAIREKGAEQFDIATSQLNEIIIPNLTKCTTYEYSSGYICEGETFIDSEIFEVQTRCNLGEKSILDLDLSVFPNPTHGVLNIEFESPITQEIKIDFVSNDGRILLGSNIEKVENTISFDVLDIPAGVYFLRISIDERTVVRKWVKY